MLWTSCVCVWTVNYEKQKTPKPGFSIEDVFAFYPESTESRSGRTDPDRWFGGYGRYIARALHVAGLGIWENHYEKSFGKTGCRCCGCAIGCLSWFTGSLGAVVGLGPGAVTGMWGPPDAVGYLDGKLLVTTDKDSPPVDFASYRVSYDYVARNRRVWFGKGVVDIVVILDSQERPSTGTVAEPAE